MNAYQDIRHMTRPVPSRPRMPRQNRAKIFAPYQALKGFSEAVHTKDTAYVRRLELSEYAQEQLDLKLRLIRRWDTVTVTWFQPKPGEDDRESGQYMTTTGTVECLDPVFHLLLLGKQKIPMEDIADLRGGNVLMEFPNGSLPEKYKRRRKQFVMAYEIWMKGKQTILFESSGRWWVLMKE